MILHTHWYKISNLSGVQDWILTDIYFIVLLNKMLSDFNQPSKVHVTYILLIRGIK